MRERKATKKTVIKRVFAVTLAVTMFFSNGYSAIPLLDNNVVKSVEAASPSLVLKPTTLYDGYYEIKKEKDAAGNERKILKQSEGFAPVSGSDLSSENNYNSSEIKYSAGGQSVLYIDEGTCLECSLETDDNFNYFDAYITDKDGRQLDSSVGTSSDNVSDDDSITRATTINRDTIPSSSQNGGVYFVTNRNNGFKICANKGASSKYGYITLYYHSKTGDVLTGFILKVVVLSKTKDFEVTGQETVVATREAEFNVSGDGGTDGYLWDVDNSLGSFSKTSNSTALFTAADAANGKEGSFKVTTYSGIDKSEESNAIIAIKSRNVSRTYKLNVAKREKATQAFFKLNSSDENYVVESFDESISDEDWEALKASNNHYFEDGEGKRFVKFAKYYLAKGKSYGLNDKFDWYPKSANDIWVYSSSNKSVLMVAQDGMITGKNNGIASVTVNPEDDNAISDKAYVEVYTLTTSLTTKKEDGTPITSYSMRSTNDIEIDVEEDADSSERIEPFVALKSETDNQNTPLKRVVTDSISETQLDVEVQWLDEQDNVVLTQTLLNPEEYFSANIKKYKFTAGTILDTKKLAITFSTNRTAGYLEDYSDISTYVSLDLYEKYTGALSLKSDNDTGELWTGKSDTITATVENINVADQIGWSFSDNNIDSDGNACLVIKNVESSNNKITITANKKPTSGKVVLTAVTKSNADKYATLDINVKKSIDSLKISSDQTKPTVNVGKTLQLVAVKSPVDSDETISWTSDNKDKATVDTDTGVVTGIEAGTVVITATAQPSGKKATISINIVEAGRISIKKTNSVDADDIGNVEGVVNSTLNTYAVVIDVNNIQQQSAVVDWEIANTDIVSIKSANENKTNVTLEFKKVGTTTVTVTSGDATKTYNVIVTAPLSKKEFVTLDDIEDQVYLPNGKVPTIIENVTSSVDARGDNYKLTNGKDYETSNSYEEGGKCSKYRFTITEKGLYTASTYKDYNVVTKLIGDGTTCDKEITVEQVGSLTFDNTAQKPTLSIKYTKDGETQDLVLGDDYDINAVSGDDLKSAGEHTVIVSGKGNFAARGTNKSSFEFKYEIAPYEINADNVTIDIAKIVKNLRTYTGSEIEPTPVVSVDLKKHDGTSAVVKLIQNTDFEFGYYNNINAGDATISVTGKGNYIGKASDIFEIYRKSVAELGIKLDSSVTYTYNGKEIEPVFNPITYNGMALKEGEDYEITLSNNIDAGTASYVITGKGNYGVALSGTYIIAKANVANLVYKDIEDQTYTGFPMTPKVSISTSEGVSLTEGLDYSLAYNKNTSETVGEKAEVIVTGKGNNFQGNTTRYFDIVIDNNVIKPATGIDITQTNGDELIDGKIYVNSGKEHEFKIKLVGDEDCDDSLKLNQDAASGYYSASLKDISSDGKAATLVVKGLKRGGSSIRIVTRSGEVNIPIEVIVNVPATKVNIKLVSYDENGTAKETDVTNKDQNLYIDHNYMFKVSLTPTDSTDEVEWSIDNDKVATIDSETGVLQTTGTGSLKVTATTKASEVSPGGVVASVPIIVSSNIAVQSIELDSTEKELKKGDSFTLKATYAPSDYTEELSWVSTDENVAKVETNGKVTAVGNGKCEIKRQNPDGTVFGVCNVSVYTIANSIILDKPTLSISEGATGEINLSFDPEDASDIIDWTVEKPEIAEIVSGTSESIVEKQSIKVTGLKTGTTKLTATARNSKKTAVCTLTVTEGEAETVTISGKDFEIENDTINVNSGDYIYLVGNASNSTGIVSESLKWISSNKSAVRIIGSDSNSEVKLQAVSGGDATITYGSIKENGVTKKINIHVIDKPSYILIDKKSLSISEGQSLELTATYNDKAVGKFVWESSDSSVVTISGVSEEESNTQKVTINGLKAGKTATITVKSDKDGVQSATCTITIADNLAETVTIDKSSVELIKGKTVTLKGTASRSTGTITEELEWKSSNPNVISITSGQGTGTAVFTAVAAGTATITYGSKLSNGKTASCVVTVKNAESSAPVSPTTTPTTPTDNPTNPTNPTETIEVGSTQIVSGNTYLVKNASEVTFKASKKSGTKITVPATVKIGGKSYKVTEISAKAFANNKKIKTVIIGKNVKKIGKEAFAGCSNLKTVTFKTKKLTKIGSKAFKTIKKGAKFKCPKAKKTKYKKMLKKSGVPKKAKYVKY
ncbi:Ig-like domain (group 2) [Lachnospiraceae bacterium]|nr:Ig-like domain (group 2) [Lachnospiraceae bacterium]